MEMLNVGEGCPHCIHLPFTADASAKASLVSVLQFLLAIALLRPKSLFLAHCTTCGVFYHLQTFHPPLHLALP